MRELVLRNDAFTLRSFTAAGSAKHPNDGNLRIDHLEESEWIGKKCKHMRLSYIEKLIKFYFEKDRSKVNEIFFPIMQ